MIKFYLKIQNKIFVKNLLIIVTFFVLIFNFLIRIFPNAFIKIDIRQGDYKTFFINIVPIELFTYCDVYLLLLFVILIFFFLGVDFNNSMEEITLAIGGSKTNKFMLKKLLSILVLYFSLYIISFINIYTIYLSLIDGRGRLIQLKEIIFYCIVTNVFIIELSLFILFLFRDIAVSVSLITFYYLIEEALWRCKIMQTNGILGHLYQYYNYSKGDIYKVKLFYLALSIILLFITYKISNRKSSFKLHKI